MKSSICVKQQSFEVRLNSVISFVFVAFCQPRILRYNVRDVTDSASQPCHASKSNKSNNLAYDYFPINIAGMTKLIKLGHILLFKNINKV